MPRKTLTLQARATEWRWRNIEYGDGLVASVEAAWLAGHRANRLTRAERAVVEAAKIYCANETTKLYAQGRDGKSHWARLTQAVSALERAKGRK